MLSLITRTTVERLTSELHPRAGRAWAQLPQGVGGRAFLPYNADICLPHDGIVGRKVMRVSRLWYHYPGAWQQP